MIKKNFENEVLDTIWYEALKNKLNKVAVQPARIDDMLFKQINDVINSKKSKFSSVEEKVKEMIERSGLSNYIKEQNKIKLSKKANSNVKLFEEYPNVKKTIDNIIEEYKGTVPVISVIDKIDRYHSNEIKDKSLLNDNNLKQYIVNRNLQLKSDPEYSPTLGKNHYKNEESEGEDMFVSLFNTK